MAKAQEKTGGELPQNTAIEPEQAEALARLEEAANSVGSAAARIEDEERRRGEIEADEWAAIPQLLSSMLAIYAPGVQDVFTPAACRAWGAAAVPVARKYGWSVSAMGCEAGLIVATLPLAIGTFQILKDEREKRDGRERYKKHSQDIGITPKEQQESVEKEEASENGGGVGRMPGVKTVVFGSGANMISGG
jgi:hypothetical protein